MSHEERFIPPRQKLDQLSVVKDYSAIPRLEYRSHHRWSQRSPGHPRQRETPEVCRDRQLTLGDGTTRSGQVSRSLAPAPSYSGLEGHLTSTTARRGASSPATSSRWASRRCSADRSTGPGRSSTQVRRSFRGLPRHQRSAHQPSSRDYPGHDPNGISAIDVMNSWPANIPIFSAAGLPHNEVAADRTSASLVVEGHHRRPR
ncbi:hypothetical protein ACHAW5_000571 [Stephanodiscus triporus]|uniref:Uncharacterized protein n=1 Tax=Stephanodiscus triporus TaxID=2934178 RepID=A0ABD3QG28_9STRA